jgi:LytR cell envelope-related transcriptional attenuator
VLVANATDVPGAASRLVSDLAEIGFSMAEPTDAAGYEEFLDTSKVYTRPESQAVAESVARQMGGIPVLRMPTPAPIIDATAGLGEATVLVMLGRDLAGRALPGPPAG